MREALRGSGPPVLAVVIPCFNEQEVLPLTIEHLSRVLINLKAAGQVATGSYLYFVDDGSSDLTWAILAHASRASEHVRSLRLSRNFGHQNALLAGLLQVRSQCDVSISIDADLQQDSSAMSVFLAQHAAGAEIVFGVRRSRDTDSVFKRVSATFFYRLMARMGARVIPNHADYRLLGAKAMAALSRYNEPDVFLRALCTQLGYRAVNVEFDVADRAAGTSKYSFGKMLKLALDGMTSFSVAPLRLITAIGLFVFCVSLLMMVYVLAVALFFGKAVPGWASTTLPIYFLGGVQILCIAVIGEYMAQILTGVKARPRYLIDEEIL